MGRIEDIFSPSPTCSQSQRRPWYVPHTGPFSLGPLIDGWRLTSHWALTMYSSSSAWSPSSEVSHGLDCWEIENLFFGTCSRANMFTSLASKLLKGRRWKKRPERVQEGGTVKHTTTGLRYLGRLFTKRADFLHGHPSFIQTMSHVPFEPWEKRKHVKTAIFHLFGAFLRLPEADIHSPNLPMVIYHVFGVKTFFGTILQFHSEWPRALELAPQDSCWAAMGMSQEPSLILIIGNFSCLRANMLSYQFTEQ